MSNPDDRSDHFSWDASTPLSQCAYCKHLGDGDLPVCAAFPGLIPPEILANESDHRKPWIDPTTGEPGDMGIPLERSITFEPRPGLPAEALAPLYRLLDEA